DVVQATRDRQVPWDHSSLVGDVILVPAVTPSIAPAAPPPPPAPGSPQVATRTDTERQRPIRPRAANEDCADYRNPIGTNRYCASSILAGQFGNSYGVRHLFENNGDAAWVEGKPGQGIGEWVVVEFDGLRLVKAIQINNGYQKNSDIYYKNSRIRRLRVVFSHGESRTFTLQDQFGAQTLS